MRHLCLAACRSFCLIILAKGFGIDIGGGQRIILIIARGRGNSGKRMRKIPHQRA